MNGGWLALVATGALAAASGVRRGSAALSVAAGQDDDGNVLVLLGHGNVPIEGAYLEIRLPSADELRAILEEDYPGVDTSAVSPGGDQPVGFLTGMELPATYRRQGWGTAMLGAGMRQATQLGAREFYVLAFPDAVPFYRKLGFVQVASTGIGPLMRIGLEDE